MAISFPRTDIITMVPWSEETAPLDLMSRQEMSRQAGGRTIGKDLGPALWFGSFVTIAMENDDAIAFQAVMNSLDGVVNTFEAYEIRRTMPRLYPTGACNNGTLDSVNANNKAITLAGLAAGQVVSVGDFLSFDYDGNRAFHQAVESATADGSGDTPEFEVRPHLRPGWELAAAVTLKNPKGIFALMPGSVAMRPEGGLRVAVSFQAVQYIA